jgi:hypothetical protein
MTVEQFKQVIDTFFSGRFQFIQWSLDHGHCKVANGTTAFPTMVCITEFRHHFIAEFFGHAERFRKLTWHCKTKSKNRCANEYFQQFSNATRGGISTSIGTRGFSFVGLTISDALDSDRAFERLNLKSAAVRMSRLQFTQPGCGTLALAERDNSLFLVDCIFLNSRDTTVRAKWLSMCVVASKDLSTTGLEKDLSFLNCASGGPRSPLEHRMQLPLHVDINRMHDAEFRSLYLTPAIRETMIGGYLALRPEVIARSLGATAFLFERELLWQPPELAKSSIKPDIFFRRQDGYWDICDLKTAELLQTTLTTGGQKRRRFKEVILEGAAQLAHYADYFKDPLNAKFAEDECGIRVNNPNLFLIVGDRDNMPQQVVLEAARMLDDRYQILDFDTVAELYAIRSAESALTSTANSPS